MDDASSSVRGGAAPLRPTMVVIAGMHRSGTSALARSCNLLGVDLGSEFIPDQPDNRSGFWEDARVKDTDDLALASFGLLWDDVRALPEPWRDGVGMAEIRDRLRRTLHALAGRGPLSGVKDPRISRLLPLWLPLLDEVGVTPAFVIALRDPDEVARSLERRDGLTRVRAQLLWLRYSLEAELHTRGHRRSLVCFDDLLRDWRGTLSRVALDLGIVWPVALDVAGPEIDTFLDPSMRHHVAASGAESGSGGAPASGLDAWTREVFATLRAMRDDDSAERRAVLDRVRAALGAADVVLGPLVAEVEAEAASRAADARGDAAVDGCDAGDPGDAARSVHARELDRARREALLAHALVAQRDAEIAELQAALATERDARDARARETAQAAARIATLEDEVAELRLGLDALREERDHARAQAESRLGTLREVEGSLSWRVTSPLRTLSGALRPRRG